MTFDINGARAAGYSDTEIADHLGKARSFDLAGARAEGYSAAEIVGHLSKVEPDGLIKRAAKAVGWNNGRTLKAPEMSEADKAGAFTAGVPEEPQGERIKLAGSVMDGQPAAPHGELKGRSFAEASQAVRPAQDETARLQEIAARPELKAPPLQDDAKHFASGLATGLKTDIGKAGAATIRAGGKWLKDEAIGNPELSQAGSAIEGAGKNLWDRNTTEEKRNQFESDNMLASGVYSGARSLEQMIAAMVTAGGNPAGTLAAMVGPMAATETGNALASGKDLAPAIAYGLGQGGLEYITEKLPMSFLMQNLGKAGFSRLVSGYLFREMPSEQLATLTQDALQKAALEPDKTWAQYLEERPRAAAETAIATGVMTGGVGALHGAVGAMDAVSAKRENDAARSAADGAKARALSAWSNGGLTPSTNPAAQADPGRVEPGMNAPASVVPEVRQEPTLASPADIPNGDGVTAVPPAMPGSSYADILAAVAARRSAGQDSISMTEPSPVQSASKMTQLANDGQTQAEALTPAPAAEDAPKVFHEVMAHLDAAGIPVTPEAEAQIADELAALKRLGLNDAAWQKAVRSLVVKHITGGHDIYEPLPGDFERGAAKPLGMMEGNPQSAKSPVSDATIQAGEGTAEHRIEGGDFSAFDSKQFSAWRNAPPVRVLSNPTHAPFEAHPKAAGAFHNGAVYLFASNLKDQAHAEFTLLHETVGHYGLAGVLGGEVSGVMRDIYRTNAGVRKAADAMMAARLDAGQVISVADATEEVLAKMAGDGGLENLNLLQRLVATIRTSLRRIGITLDFTRDDLAALLTRARHFVEDGTTSGALAAPVRYALNTDPTLKSALLKSGLTKDPESFKDKIRGVFDRLPGKDVWRQEVFDKFHGIQLVEGRNIGNLPFEQSAYVAARFSTGLSSILRGILLHGAPRWMNDVRLEKIPNSKGLLQILDPVKNNLDDFLGWMVGERANRLMQEGRENNFTQDEIDALRSLAGNRVAEFRQVRNEFAEFKRSILDVAEKSGLIDGSTRPMWDNLDWIPFYRTMDDAEVVGPHSKKGFAGQRSGIKQLKGGKSAINDPLENILMNFSHLIDASLKNNVLRLAIDHAPDAVEQAPHTMAAQLVPFSQVKRILLNQGVDEALVELIPKDALEGLQKMWSIQVPTGKDIVRLMRNGKAEFYRVQDPLLLRALTSFEALQLPGLNLARSMRRLLTTLTTSTPDFIARNYMRDVVAVMITTRHGFHLGDSVHGLGKSWNESGGFEDMLFAGASFAGGHVDSGDPKEAARNVRRTLRSQGYKVAWHDVLTKTWEAYRSVGDAVENANREAIYEATMEQTGSTTKAAYEAKDIMDFSLRGSHPMVNLLADVIPFLNSRMQGMYRLGRADPKRALIGGLMLMAFSLLLLAINHDDERYQALPDWEKDTYWHFFTPGVEGHLRIPKPFELGALFGSIPERMMSRLMGDIDTKKLMQRVAWNVYEQLKIDLIPQIVKPAGEAAANYDLFGGRPIENAHDLKLPANQRANAHTSPTMKLVADTGKDLLNPINMGPKRLEHVWNGYFGAMGMYALGLSDMAVRTAQGTSDRPTLRLDDYPLIKSFWRVDPAHATQFKNDLYDMYREVSELEHGIDQLAADGQRQDARAMMQENIDKLRQGGRLSAAADALRLLQKRMDRIYADPNMSSNEKRAKLDELTERGNAIAMKTVKRVRQSALKGAN